ncbi:MULTISPECIES: DUF418 domain-containing protein [Actinomadura]|uniref:DUF418 domain-containing protein n=1 Tax=Actinomadura yumaensis TaxID=111807 RepID=A0ABW2CH23_9ACTN|nr:DUF418 domain-containing protein [Actinomadura sp. J1-007]MWK34708.1 DUF418 domain-containing protein [Actinomadura sp. J1-007]
MEAASGAIRRAGAGPSPSGAAGEPERLLWVDALRGLALCGIAFVNVGGLTGTPVDGNGLGHWVYELGFHGRFFPVFAFLFGFSFTLFLKGREASRVVALARLGFLIPIGVLHRALQPDEVLLSYAVVGIAVLVPASFLPRNVVAGCGAVATAAALVAGGGSLLIPGLFLVGSAAAEYRLRNGFGAWVAVGFVAVALNAMQVANGSATVAAAAGVATGAAYSVGLAALIGASGRAAGLAAAVLEPLGRTALTNYLGATVLILAADRLFADEWRFGWVAAILAVQIVLARWWLARFRYGPAEWVWRCLTWWRLVPNGNRRAGTLDRPRRT